MTAKRIAALGLSLAVSTAAHGAVVISGAATKHMNCSAGVCAPSAKNAVLNAGELQTMLAASDVTITTGSGALEIGIAAPVTWASANRLTLDANRGVSVKAAVVSQGTGGVTITLNDGGSGGNLAFFPGGSIGFWDNSSSLIIDGHAYTLESDLAALASAIALAPTGFYALAKDPALSNPYTAAPIPTLFQGNFEGLGHAITRIDISPQEGNGLDAGLFAQTAPGSVLRDVHFVRSNMLCLGNLIHIGLLAGVSRSDIYGVTAEGSITCDQGNYVGGLVGLIESGSLTNSSAKVQMDGRSFITGGLAGENDGTIANASASGRVGGGYNSDSGGLVGYNIGLIADSHATGNVFSGQANASGGLVALAGGTIERCYATGSVTAKNGAGGLVGSASGATIDSSFATGSAHAVRYAGGLAGIGKESTVIVNSYSTGAAAATAARAWVGGLAGDYEGAASIATSYSTGAVSGTGFVGGFVGLIKQTPVTGGYWDLDTSTIADPAQGAGNKPDYPGIAGLTTAQFQSGLPAGFDPSVWAQSVSINNGYPYLIANPPQ